MQISLIVAAADDWAIGRNNDLLWHLPNDLKFFKNTTWGMPVVMGRKTYTSIAGEPLPGRFNIVVTRSKDFDPGNADVWVVNSLSEAITKAQETNCLELFIAGGGEIYTEAMPLAGRVYLTRVHARFPEATVYFRGFDETAWKRVSVMDFPADEKHAYPYAFEVWER